MSVYDVVRENITARQVWVIMVFVLIEMEWLVVHFMMINTPV